MSFKDENKKYLSKVWTVKEMRNFKKKIHKERAYLIKIGFIDKKTGLVLKDIVMTDIAESYAIISLDFESVFNGNFLDIMRVKGGITYREHLQS